MSASTLGAVGNVSSIAIKIAAQWLRSRAVH